MSDTNASPGAGVVDAAQAPASTPASNVAPVAPQSGAAAAPAQQMSLEDLIPDEPIAPTWDIGRARILLYGPPKIGKSSLANEFPGSIFLPTEPGLSWIKHHQIPAGGGIIESWEQIGQAFAALRTQKARERFKTVIIDTVDIAWILCERYVCAKNGVNVPADLAYGKGYQLVSGEFHRMLAGIERLGYGVILLSHAEIKEFENAETKARTSKIVPSYPDKCRRLVNPYVDMILLYGVETLPTQAEGGVRMLDHRTIRCRSAIGYDAGDRTRTMPERIVLPSNPRDAYAALAKAYSEGAEQIARDGGAAAGAVHIPVGFEKKAKPVKDPDDKKK